MRSALWVVELLSGLIGQDGSDGGCVNEIGKLDVLNLIIGHYATR
jgi:hypothetical protein